MNAATANAAAATPAPIAATKPDPATCAQTLRIEGTLPAAQWAGIVDEVERAIAARNEASRARRASAKAKRWIGATAVVVAALVVAVGFAAFAGLLVLVVGLVLAIRLVRLPPEDTIGLERVRFVRDLVAELGKTGGRVALRAQCDARRAIDDTPLPGGGDARSVRSREENWLRGELQGLRGLFLGWSLTEWHTLTRVRKRNPRGRVKVKAKLAIARRTSVRLDADGALFASSVSRSGGAVQPQGLVEVRETPRGWSVRGRHEYQGKFALHHPDDLGASLAEIRRGTGYQGRDREDVLGQYASTLVYLMKQCEQRLAPRT